MVTFATVEEQLKNIGCNFRFWGRSEIMELSEVLLPGEQIAQIVNGQYENSFAMLCATDIRVLLIDKKPKYLSLKDIRFDMITELDFSNRLLSSTIRIYTPNRELSFTTPSTKRLRKLFTHTQHKVMEIRHRFMMQQFQQPDLQNLPPGIAANFTHQLPPQEPPVAAIPAQSASMYHMEANEEQKRLASVMGAAGLLGAQIVHSGKVVKEYTTIPFTQRWRKRPYGYSRNSVYQPE